MAYAVRYAGICFRGLVRRNNEDNFFLNGTYLPEGSDGTENVVRGMLPVSKCPIFGVFDGMGGLDAGEAASFLAVQRLSCRNRKKGGLWTGAGRQSFILKSCMDMNRSIVDYAKENGIRDMGTTMAMAVFGCRSVQTANLGDSSIYCMSGGKLKKLSRDHVINLPGMRKAPLTQYLGMDEGECRIEPHMERVSYEDGMQLLFCTDGATDMLSERELGDILARRTRPSEKAETFRQAVLRKGAVDNTTVILAEVCRM